MTVGLTIFLLFPHFASLIHLVVITFLHKNHRSLGHSEPIVNKKVLIINCLMMKFPIVIASLVQLDSAAGFGILHPMSVRCVLQSPKNPPIRSTYGVPTKQPLKTALYSTSLPSLEQLSSDPFMKQVNYAFEIVPLLGEGSNHDEDLKEMISAQLR